MVRIVQFRYYDDDNPNNFPAEGTYSFFCTDASFSRYKPIHQFGIQTLPGTKIYLNQSYNPIVIGSTGIFEIDCDNTTATLNSFRVEEASMTTIKNNPNGYLIIDIVYGEKGED